MEPDNPIGQFLRARREQVQPEDVGIESYGRRRVPGLRREELAMLAGVSVDYYVRLEQGRERHPSEQVLEALARALRLDDTAARHLQELARPPARRRRPSARPQRVRPGVKRLMDGWTHTPAFVMGRCMDVLAANSLAEALHGRPLEGTNVMRSIFLDSGARDFYADWEEVARDTVATLRALAGADLDDPRLTELVGELSLKSPGLPSPMGATRRPREDERNQAVRAPDRRGAVARLRVVRHRRRAGADPHRVPRRAR
jgi:transcriptional regulator with XRE-family HTH domain